MNYLRRKTGIMKAMVAVVGMISAIGCSQMSQQRSGQMGAATGAVLGAAGLTAVAKKQGARGSDLLAPALIGAVGGGSIGNAIGQQTGTPGVYKTEVPNP